MSAPRIDLRTDTLSPPTPEMLEALTGATIGWPLRDEDENVSRLEEAGRRILAKEACLFVANVTTGNLLTVMVQAPRGSAVLMDRESHINEVEWYGVTAMAGAAPWLLASDRGSLDPAAVEAAFLDRNGDRRPRISALVLENTHNFAGGVAISLAETAALASVAHRYGAVVHLDGARLPNAAAALGRTMDDLAGPVDTVTLSLTKGLCAPFGALLAGPRVTIDAARVLARHLGFGRLHKVGYLAAAGRVALETMVERVVDDHRRTRVLAESLAAVPALEVDLETVQTNIVMARLRAPDADSFAIADAIAGRGVGLLPFSGGRLRAVLHRGIGNDEVAEAGQIVRDALA